MHPGRAEVMPLATVTVDDLDLTDLAHFPDITGNLTVAAAPEAVPFSIVRVFTIVAPAASFRGQHAHRHCRQFMFCPDGHVSVIVNDAKAERVFELDSADKGLLVPPGIWAEERFHAVSNTLVVLCDRPYEESDYIREYSDYLDYRKT